jgi:hypothetical protein
MPYEKRGLLGKIGHGIWKGVKTIGGAAAKGAGILGRLGGSLLGGPIGSVIGGTIGDSIAEQHKGISGPGAVATRLRQEYKMAKHFRIPNGQSLNARAQRPPPMRQH